MHDIMFPGLPDISNVILLPALQSINMYRMDRDSIFRLHVHHRFLFLFLSSYENIPCLPTSCLRGTHVHIYLACLGIGYLPSNGHPVPPLSSSGMFEQSYVTL